MFLVFNTSHLFLVKTIKISPNLDTKDILFNAIRSQFCILKCYQIESYQKNLNTVGVISSKNYSVELKPTNISDI